MGEGGKDKEAEVGTSLAAHWLRLRTSKAGGVGLIPGQGTKILHATLCSQKKKSHCFTFSGGKKSFKCFHVTTVFCFS